MLARADWLRGHPSETNIEAAIADDPMNAQGYMLRAEQLELRGRPELAKSTWQSATARDEHNPEAWIHLGLSAESLGDTNNAESDFLRAAAVSRMWLPRWNLVNFYIRQNRPAQCRKWARLAFESASDDVAGLFAVLESASIDVETLLPNNRPVLTAYISHCVGTRTPSQKAAFALLNLIPQSTVAWPGAESPLATMKRTESTSAERGALLNTVNALMDRQDGSAAVELWNALQDKRIISSERWTPNRPIINSRFRYAHAGGLDWSASETDHTDITPGADELTVHLDGHQAEFVDLITQRVFLPASRSYLLAVESATSGLDSRNGLEWQVRLAHGATIATLPVPSSATWLRSATPVPATLADRIGTVVLTCRRQPAAMRAEGSARFRVVSLEATQ